MGSGLSSELQDSMVYGLISMVYGLSSMVNGLSSKVYGLSSMVYGLSFMVLWFYGGMRVGSCIAMRLQSLWRPWAWRPCRDPVVVELVETLGGFRNSLCSRCSWVSLRLFAAD